MCITNNICGNQLIRILKACTKIYIFWEHYCLRTGQFISRSILYSTESGNLKQLKSTAANYILLEKLYFGKQPPFSVHHLEVLALTIFRLFYKQLKYNHYAHIDSVHKWCFQPWGSCSWMKHLHSICVQIIF